MEIRYGDKIVARVLPGGEGLIGARDEIERLAEGVYRWTRVFSAEGGPYPVSGLRMDLMLDFAAEWRMIPAVSYDGNEWGDGKEPRGFSRGGVPYTFAHHRVSVAGCSYAESGEWGVGIFADTRGLSCGLACSILEREGKTVLRVVLPEQEMPCTFPRKGALAEGYGHTAPVGGGVELSCTALICASPRGWGRPGYARLLDIAWERNYHVVRPWFDERRLWELSMRYAKESLWAEEGPYRGFSIGLAWDGLRFRRRERVKYEAGWCGQNISLGASFLYDHLMSGDGESLEKGLACLDTWAAARLDNGLMFVQYDPLLEGEEQQLASPIDACNLGAAVENFLEASELAARCGVDRPAYREIALGICDFALSARFDDGHLPSAFNRDGEITRPDGSTGGFLVPGMLWAYALTRDEKYLSGAKRAFDFYANALEVNGFTTAGALDTHCIDKESAMPLLSSALMLHHLTGEEGYLTRAEYAAYYLSTWQWHHSVDYPEGTLLRQYGYDTFGGTSVSTQHHHLDPYALRYVPYLLRLSELTGREIWRQRALAAWNNASIGVSDGTLVAAGKLRPAGSQEEGIFHTRWGKPFFSSEWLVAWPAAFRLEALRKTDFFRKSPLYPDGVRV